MSADNITLPWADKFRKLCQQHPAEDVIAIFTEYANAQEFKVRNRFMEAKNDNKKGNHNWRVAKKK